jgi:ankyrin repeat protein
MMMVLRRAVCRERAAEPSFPGREGGQDKVVQIRLTLHEAVRRNDLELVKKAAERTTNFNETDAEGKTPLMIAAKHSSNVIANFLLSKGASINSRDNDGRTCMEIAAENKNWGVVNLLDHVRGWNTLD